MIDSNLQKIETLISENKINQEEKNSNNIENLSAE